MKLRAKVSTNSSCNKIEWLNQNNYKVWLTQKPFKNKANQQLVQFLAEYFQVPRVAVKILKGMRSKNKLIQILNSNKEKQQKRLKD